MSAEFATTDRVSVQQAVTLTGTPTFVFRAGRPINVKRLTLVVTTAITGTVGAATYGVRNRDGTSSVTLGSFAVPNAALNAVLAAELAGVKVAAVVNSGEVSQNPIIGNVNGYQTNLPGEVKLNPGQELFVTIGTSPSAGAVDASIEYQDEGSNPTRFAPTAMAVTFS